MKLVKNWEQVVANLQLFQRYLASADAQEREFAGALLRRGICFVVYKTPSEVLAGPSRFIGYAGNTMQRHMANTDKNGRETNPAISGILGTEPRSDEGCEKEYLQFCRKYGIERGSKGAFGKRRKYWCKS